MSMEINGKAILLAIVNEPSVFSISSSQIDTLATYALTSKMKEKGFSLDTMRVIASAIGFDDFETIIGNLPAKDAKSLAKLDAKHPELKTADEHWCRAHLIKLGKGEIEPAPALAKTPRAPKQTVPKSTASKSPKIGKIMASEAQATAGRARKTKAK